MDDLLQNEGSAGTYMASHGGAPPPHFYNRDENERHGPQEEEEAPPPMSVMSCMSVIVEGPRIVFAAYQEESNQIIMEECYANGYEVEGVVESVMGTVRPTLLLLPVKVMGNSHLLDLLTQPLPELQQDNEDGIDEEDAENYGDIQQEQQQPPTHDNNGATAVPPQSKIPFRPIKSSLLEERSCRALILQKLRVQALQMHRSASMDPPAPHSAMGPSTCYSVSHYHALASVIDLESKLQVQAVGTLLHFLTSTMFSMEEGGYVEVDKLIWARTSMFMNISASTLSALHVFAMEHHPLVAAKRGGNSKEGFSLFSLLDQTQTRHGRQRLREWLYKPLVDVELIAQRQDGVELFTLPGDMEEVAGVLLKNLPRVGPVDKIITRIQKSCPVPMDLLTLLHTLLTAIRICQILEHQVLWHWSQQAAAAAARAGDAMQTAGDDHAARYTAFLQDLVGGCSVQAMQQLVDRLMAAIDEPESNECQGIVIKRGYNEELDEVKDCYYNLHAIIEEAAEPLKEQNPLLRDIENLVIFLPQIGFLVELPKNEGWAPESLPEDFEFVFKDESFVHYKCGVTMHLDQTIGDPDSEMRDKEALLVAELEDAVLQFESELRGTFDCLADLDCIIALACSAKDAGYVRPQVLPAEANCIEIRNGRHPLQETVLESKFVPNDTNMGPDSRISIVTGPNYSGKSSYARQVGLLVVMAHIGCFVPCDQMRISVVHQILAQFSTVETCSVPQSSFQLDLSQMGNMLHRASPGSLVLIDEFGKGTSPASGVALLTSALKKLAASQCKVVCTTHFLEIFSLGLLSDGENGFKARQMAFRIPEDADDLAIPLFKLEDGVATSSAGLSCAKLSGLKDSIIGRAREMIDAMKERRQVKPLLEILRANLALSSVAKAALRTFLNTDWSKATDGEIDQFLSMMQEM